MMLHESFEKNARPRNPEKMYTSEPISGLVSTQNTSPMLYDAGEVTSPAYRAVEYLPENTQALSVSECVRMFLLQFIPLLSLVLDCFWSFAPTVHVMKRTIARALLISQCIVLLVAFLAWLIH